MSATMLAKVLDELEIGQSAAECLLVVCPPGERWLHAEMSSGPCRAGFPKLQAELTVLSF